MILALSFLVFDAAATRGDEANHEIIRSVRDGLWSAAETWDADRAPAAGDRVVICAGHDVIYDVASDAVIRGICISGTLRFPSDRDTLLNVGLIRIEAGDAYSEDGFDCLHAMVDNDEPEHAVAEGARPALEIGTQQQPISAQHTAMIRLHYVEGMDRETCPAIICCGGRMDIHGAPLNRTWVKMTRNADAGATRLFLAEAVEGWKPNDQLLITGTTRQEPSAGTARKHVSEYPSSEVGRLRRLDDRRKQMLFGSSQILELQQPLERNHTGGEEFSGEVANLSRNVVIESADPEGVRGHTMYHRGSTGSISYAEFRHLGKKGVLGKYPIHFHLVGDSMRGSSVVGVSVWDSHNRWITIHGTQYLVVRDCVGYQSLGHGYFLEDGTEVYNLLDRNLAVQAMITEPLPKQALPFDLNNGAGFWWANSLNAFSRNVAVECDQYGFRFEAEASEEFDPKLPILQPDGTTTPVDVRTLPFICFDDNEAHCHRRFGLNLGGIRGMMYRDLYAGNLGGAEYSVTGTVGGVGPDRQHPFQIRNFKVWDTHWAFHSGSPCVHVDGLNVFDCNYGIWRSVIDLHQYNNISFRNIHSHAISFPTGGHGPDISFENGRPSYPATDPVDDLPPVTVVTHVGRGEDGSVQLRGTTADNGVVTTLHINEQSTRIDRQGSSEWTLDYRAEADDVTTLSVFAVDEAGNRELRPHVVRVPAE